MSWLEPEFLWLLLPLGALLFNRLRDEETSGSGAKRFWLVLAALLLIAALCRPVIERAPVEIDATGSDVIVAVDLSYSMQSTDVSPTRLEAARGLLSDLVRTHPHDRFGVIGFTTSAIVLSPMTNDGELLLHLFGALDETLVMTKGTQFDGALKLARKMSRAERPTVLLLTDGGDALNYSDEAVWAKRHGLRVNVVMLASRSGSTLSAPDGSLVKDEEGHIVVTARNDAVEQISRATGGTVIDGADLAGIDAVLEAQAQEAYRSKTKVMQYDELFYYFVLASIAAFILGVTSLGRRLLGALAAFLLLFGIGAQADVADGYYLYDARKLYDAGRYEEAARSYESVEGTAALYNAAGSLYRAGKYEEAIERYESIRSADPRFKAALYFNVANCYIRLKEYAKAEAALRKSLALHYDREAVENLFAISGAEAQDHMLSGRQEGKKRAQQSQSQSESQNESKGKEGGGSNMDVSAAASGSGADGKKASSDPRLDFSRAQGVLGSRQYELINQRSVHETKPW